MSTARIFEGFWPDLRHKASPVVRVTLEPASATSLSFYRHQLFCLSDEAEVQCSAVQCSTV